MIEENIDLDSIKDKIKKIQAMVERGSDQEAANAKDKLNKILNKHNITLEQVYEEKLTQREYRCYSEYEKKLFIHCIVKYCGKKRKVYCSRRDSMIYFVDMSRVEFIDIQEAMSFHKVNLKKEFKKMFTAYLHIHKLFDERDYEEDLDENVDSSMTVEEAMEIANLMEGMGKDRFTKKLKNAQKLIGD